MTFHAQAAGPADAIEGQPLAFDTETGWHVVLTTAKMHIGAIYLNESVPTSGAQDTSCVSEGVYSGEVTTGVDIDVLSSTPQPARPLTGNGTSARAITGEVWLTGGDVNAMDDPTVIVNVVGTATQGGASYPFTATVSIGANRAVPPSNLATPGMNPICKQRIVSAIPTDVVLTQGGTLLVRIDPRNWFIDTDFSQLEQVSAVASRLRHPRRRHDGSRALPSSAALHAKTGVYTFTWQP